MATKIIVVGHHTDESIRRFTELPQSTVVFAERAADITPEDAADAELYVGSITPELVAQMPRLRFVQLYSAGAGSHTWLPERMSRAASVRASTTSA